MNTETPNNMLREIKDSTDWSEPAIASELGISQPTVNRILNGQPTCSSKTYLAICALRERVRRSASRKQARVPTPD